MKREEHWVPPEREKMKKNNTNATTTIELLSVERNATMDDTTDTGLFRFGGMTFKVVVYDYWSGDVGLDISGPPLRGSKNRQFLFHDTS